MSDEVNLSLNADDYFNEVASVLANNIELGTSIDNLALKFVKFNEKTGIITARVTADVNKTQNAVVDLKRSVEDFSLVDFTAKLSPSPVNDLKQELSLFDQLLIKERERLNIQQQSFLARRQAQKEAFAAGDISQPGFKAVLGTSGVRVEELNQVDTAVDKMVKKILFNQEVIEKTKIAVQDLRNRGLLADEQLGKVVKTTNTLQSDKIKIAASELKNVSEEAEKTNIVGQKIILTLNQAIRLVEAQLLKQAINAVTNALYNGVIAAKDFQLRIAEIQTISQQTSLTTEQWTQGIVKLSNEFGKPATDVAEAAYQALSNQVTKGAQTFDFLRSSLKLAIATQSDAATSGNALASVLNSYNLAFTESDRISAEFFKTVDLGRIRLGEVANTIGRVTNLASQLGVSETEVFAGLATLTINGVKASEAMTLLNNVFAKLIKPTEEMKKLYEQLGVSSGEVAISTFGFSGFMKILEDRTKGTSGEMAKLFDEIRGLRGALGITSAFDNFATNLEKIKNSGKDFNNAIKIIDITPAQTLNKELQKVKNFFLTDLGDSFITSLADISKSVGGVSDVLIFTGKTVLVLGSAFFTLQGAIALYNTTITVASAATGGYSFALATTEVRLFSAAGAQSVFNSTVKNLPGILGLASIAIGTFGIALPIFREQMSKSAIETKTLNDRLQEQAKFLLERQKNSTISVDVKNDKLQGVTLAFQALLKGSADNLARINNELDKIQQKGEKLKDALKISFQVFELSIGDRIRELTSRITELQNIISSSAKNINDFGQKINDQLFETQLKHSTPEAQLSLLKEKITVLLGDINQLQENINKDNVESARKKFDELANIIQQYYDKLLAGSKTQPQLQANLSSLQDAYNGLLQRKVDFERAATREAERQIELIKQQKSLEEERLKTIKQLATQITEFNVRNKDGNIKGEFLDKQGVIDSVKVLDKFTEFKKKLLDQIDDKNTAAQVLGQLAQVELNLVQQLELEKAAIKEREFQTRANKERNDTIEQFNKLKGIIEVKQKEISSDLNPLTITEDQLKKFKEKLDEVTSKVPFKKFVDLESVKSDIINVLAQIEQFRSAIKANEPIDVIKIKNVDEQIKSIITQLGELKNNKVTGDLIRIELKDLEKKFNITPTGLIELRKELNTFVEDFRIANEKFTALNPETFLQKIINNSPATLQALNGIILEQQNLDSITKISTQNIDNYFDILINKANSLADAIRAIPPLPAAPVGGGQAPFDFGGLFNRGGFVPGARTGRDSVLIGATPGEFIMNEFASRAFAPQLIAMNRIKGYNSGGFVTNNNLGDINVNISGGNVNNPEQLGRRVANVLKREIRRGNVKL